MGLNVLTQEHKFTDKVTISELTVFNLSASNIQSGQVDTAYTTLNANSAYWADTRKTTVFGQDLTISGNLTALGTSTFKNTIFTTTSALSVINYGPGPALYVFQTSGPSDIASFRDGNNNEILHIGNSNIGQPARVGINESDPSTELTVNGSISAKNNLTVLDLFVQNNLTINNSLTSQQDIIVNQLTVGKGNSSLSGNTALGVNALYNAQRTSSNDSRAFAGMNVAVGYNALSANTQGWQNVAIGYNALARNTDSREQVAVGAGVLGKSTGQGYNTAVGQSAMNETTTGQQNAAFGYATLWGNTTGNSNAACGFAVMFNNNTGANNTGLGSSALYNVYNCSNNVGVGASALRNTGQINAGQFLIGTNYTIAFVGSTDFTSVGAADNNIGTAFTATGAGTGSGTVYRTSAISNNNVGIGTDALRTNSTGQNNTALGHQAGYGNNSSNATLSGNNNLFLGYRALGSDRGDSNSIVIGANAIGNGSNTLTLGDSNIARHIFTAGNVGINTTTPNERLTINGNISSSNIGYFDHIQANTKSFYINHPTKSGHALQYGSLESPYHGVRLTGKSKINESNCVVINLPDYINALVTEENINIQLTNYKHDKVLYVDSINLTANSFTVKTNDNSKNLEFFWTFTAIRKDIPQLQVEV